MQTDADVGEEAGPLRTAEPPRTCDVAVVGAGPAGSATARWLALRGASVALIERSRFQSRRVGESLAPAVQPALVELGLWNEFQALGPLPSYGTRSHWGDVAPRVHSHVMSPWASGWHVDRRAFDLMLARAAASAGATLVTGVTVAGCRGSAAGWILDLRHDEGHDRHVRAMNLRARVVVDATGRATRLAALFHARRVAFDRLVGVASIFDGIDVSREGYVMVETTPRGWWYSAPIPRGALMVMAMTDSDICGRFRLATSDAWSTHLATAAATRARAPVGHAAWGPRVFPAASHRLVRGDCRRAWLAVGDAALAVDPVSGSGVVRALRSARAGAEAALALLEHADSEAIRACEAERDRECTAYLQERAMYYGLERRWPAAEFWSRRRMGGEIPSPVGAFSAS
ncbi:MAG: FAD-dependent oxidoreductase [Betaproteobacteria bacterium]